MTLLFAILLIGSFAANAHAVEGSNDALLEQMAEQLKAEPAAPKDEVTFVRSLVHCEKGATPEEASRKLNEALLKDEIRSEVGYRAGRTFGPFSYVAIRKPFRVSHLVPVEWQRFCKFTGNGESCAPETAQLCVSLSKD